MVEQRTENPRVSGSTPLLGTSCEIVVRNQGWGGTPAGKREVRVNT